MRYLLIPDDLSRNEVAAQQSSHPSHRSPPKNLWRTQYEESHVPGISLSYGVLFLNQTWSRMSFSLQHLPSRSSLARYSTRWPSQYVWSTGRMTPQPFYHQKGLHLVWQSKSPNHFHSDTVRCMTSGRPQPPGQTHRMNIGGQPEKPALEQYGVDLTSRAKDGKLDPVIGRDAEIHRTIQVLSRRTKNNPVLTGAAGVGKTAIIGA